MTAAATHTRRATRDKNDPGSVIPIPEAKQAEFKALTRAPEYAVPTLVLAAFCIFTAVFFMVAGFTGALNIYLASLGIAVVYYWFFSIIHDAIHRSVSKNKKLNEFIGQLGSTIFNPIASLELFRWGHFQHHRHTNDEKDIDVWSHGPAWSLPLRWITIDAHYLIRALTSQDASAKKALRAALPYIGGGLLFIVALIASGHGFEYLMLFLIPSRLAFIAIGFSFFWLPHAHWPNDQVEIRQSKNFTLATTVRFGKEWLLNPLLQFQNYHLIHHMWPSTPFYNNEKVWKLLEPELLQRDLAVTRDFQIMPELQFNSAGKAAEH